MQTKIDFSKLQTLDLNAELGGICIVKEAFKLMTKANKPYLNITLSDGVTTITANIWNWTSNTIPQANDLVEVSGTVGMFAGNRQLNVGHISRYTGELTTKDFLPTGGVDVAYYINRYLIFTEQISNKCLREITNSILYKYKDLWETTPGAVTVHHDYLAGTLQHSVDVCNNALAISVNYKDIVNTDLLIAGALLHDAGKLATYKFNVSVIEMTDQGMLLDHIPLGMRVLEEYRALAEQYNCSELFDILESIVLSHHGKLEYGSPITARCIEAMIICYADGIDAKCQTYRAANRDAQSNKWTGKVYFIDNKPMLTSDYINSIVNNLPIEKEL